MMGELEVDDLKAVMDVSTSLLCKVSVEADQKGYLCPQLWLENQSHMVGLSSTIGRVSSVLSALSNALLGQTRSQARLNAIASYDQSNELFKVRCKSVLHSHRLLSYIQRSSPDDLIHSRHSSVRK